MCCADDKFEKVAHQYDPVGRMDVLQAIFIANGEVLSLRSETAVTVLITELAQVLLLLFKNEIKLLLVICTQNNILVPFALVEDPVDLGYCAVIA